MSCECKNSKSRPAVVLFSGGFDSTYLIFKLLSEHREVVAITIKASMTGDFKLASEQASIDKLKPMMEEYASQCDAQISFSTLTVSALSENVTKSLSYDNARLDNSHAGNVICQPIFWLCNALPLIKDGSEILFSYIEGDRSISKLSFMEQMIENAARIMDKHFKISYPLVGLNKSEILEELYFLCKDAIDICYSCEHIGLYRCGKCKCCKSVRSALIELCLKTYADDKIAHFWRSRLNEWYFVDVGTLSSNCDKETSDESSREAYGCNEDKKYRSDAKEVFESEICNNCDNLAAGHTCLLCGCDFISPYASDCLCEKCKSMLSRRN